MVGVLQCYNWLIEFCKKTELKSDNLGLIHKLLFAQRIRTQTGTFFEYIAMQIAEALTPIKDVRNNCSIDINC